MFNIFAVFLALFALVTKEEQECDGASAMLVVSHRSWKSF